MALKVAPKKEPRIKSVSVRLSLSAFEALKKLADSHNLSQADVVEQLILDEMKHQEEQQGKKSKRNP